MPANSSAPAPKHIENNPTGDGILLVLAKVNGAAADIEISNIPPDSQVECFLNNEALSRCESRFTQPLKEGLNVFEVQARKNSLLIAFGEARLQNGGDTQLNSLRADAEQRDPLLLAVDDPAVSNGMSVPMLKDFAIKFKFVNKSDCDPKLSCSYDQREASLWHQCTSKNSEIIPGELVAKGLQYLSIRGECNGKFGPTLKLFWYGVTADYQWLALDRFKAGKSQEEFFLLSKNNDCPESLLSFECSTNTQNNFSACKNRVSKISEGFAIRAKCDGKTGPIYVASVKK